MTGTADCLYKEKAGRNPHRPFLTHRSVMNRSIVLLAAAMPLAMAIGLGAVAAGPAPAALAADNCHDPGLWYDSPAGSYLDDQYWDALGTGTGDEVVSELVQNTDSMDPSEWCVVANGSDSALFRLKDTSECATYNGPAKGTPGGTGYVYLQPCDSSVKQQNWYWDGQSPDLMAIATLYNANASCLSATSLNGDTPGTTTTLVLVDNCVPDGGQIWTWTGATAPPG
jgi:hypothetical protein